MNTNVICPQSKLSLDGQLARTSVSAILDWNRKVRSSVKEVICIYCLCAIFRRLLELQKQLKRSIRALLYPVSGERPRTIFVPAVTLLDDDAIAVWPEDLNLRQWFPFGSERTRLSYFPLNPQHSLRNHYSIFTSKPEDRLAVNDYFSSRWDLDVYGNIVVVRHANRNLMRVTNLQSVEHQLVDYLVVRFVLLCCLILSVVVMTMVCPAGFNYNACTQAIIPTASCRHLPLLELLLTALLLILFIRQYSPCSLLRQSVLASYTVLMRSF